MFARLAAAVLKLSLVVGCLALLFGIGVVLGSVVMGPGQSGGAPTDAPVVTDGPVDSSDGGRSPETGAAPTPSPTPVPATPTPTNTPQPLENAYPVPTEYTRDRRIDSATYTWDRWTDPDDPGNSEAATERSTIDAEHVEHYVFEKVNDVRTERDLAAFEYGAYLSSISRAHSEDMYDRDYFAHRNPDGERIWHRFGDDEWGDACEGISENIAQNWAGTEVSRSGRGGTGTYWTDEELAEAIVQQWMHSPPHREAMLAAEYDVMGIGVYVAEVDDDDGAVVYATQGLCDYPDDESRWGNPADAPD